MECGLLKGTDSRGGGLQLLWPSCKNDVIMRMAATPCRRLVEEKDRRTGPESPCKSLPVLPASRSLLLENNSPVHASQGHFRVFLASSRSESCFPINLSVFDRFRVWGIKLFKMIPTMGK